jgi:hypothetical protein
MSRRWIVPSFVLAAAVAAGGFFAGRATSEEPPPAAPSPEDMMKEWMKMKTPGAQHEALKQFEGSWTGTGTWTEGGMKMKFSEDLSSKLVYEGRFVQTDSKMTITSDMFPTATMVSLSFLGFDNAKQKYVLAMVGDMSTAIGSAEGSWDAGTKTLTMSGTEIQSPGKERKFRMTQKFASKDEFSFEMFFTSAGSPEAKVGEGVYKRK